MKGSLYLTFKISDGGNICIPIHDPNRTFCNVLLHFYAYSDLLTDRNMLTKYCFRLLVCDFSSFLHGIVETGGDDFSPFLHGIIKTGGELNDSECSEGVGDDCSSYPHPPSEAPTESSILLVPSQPG